MTAPRKRPLKRARSAAQTPQEAAKPRKAGRRPIKRAESATEPSEGHVRPTRSKADGPVLRTVRIGSGLPTVPQLWQEVQDMTDHLLGRTTTPDRFGVLSLMEVSDAYYARASEITMLIQAAERSGSVTKGSGYYKFRTGELRTFLEMCKRAHDLGSRRLTQEQLNFEQSRTGRAAV